MAGGLAWLRGTLRGVLVPAALALSQTAADAAATVTSPAPQAVSVTVYRDPDRTSGEAMNLSWLNGYALISEVRTIDIPAGEADIRFEGVAGGIVPESAIVTGLPDGVVEKNQDAYLLSPASLLDRSLGERVHLRRTSRATGKVVEQEAVVRTGAEGAVVVQTADGIEALRCTGLAEAIVYDRVPEGLSARPTLSVRTRSRSGTRATVTLSYLASGFDWQANYVANLNATEDRIDLFAWVTLANGDETSFVGASAQTVAGKPNREEDTERNARPDRGLRLTCWPQATTSDIAEVEQFTHDAMAGADFSSEEIVVTAMYRGAAAAPAAVTAVQEELGDLKLYRIPVPVTVAANSQKQVAFLEKAGIAVQTFYRARIRGWMGDAPFPATRVLKARNRAQDGLGVALPAGGVMLFADGYERPVLVGEGSVDDRAVGEDVEVEIGGAPGVFVQAVRTSHRDGESTNLLTVTNDRARPVRFSAEFDDVHESDIGGGRKVKLGRRNGRPVWTVTVPANGAATLAYRVREDR